ncbi:hypothetical protein D3C76_1515170 [compost metagenome]
MGQGYNFKQRHIQIVLRHGRPEGPQGCIFPLHIIGLHTIVEVQEQTVSREPLSRDSLLRHLHLEIQGIALVQRASRDNIRLNAVGSEAIFRRYCIND